MSVSGCSGWRVGCRVQFPSVAGRCFTSVTSRGDWMRNAALLLGIYDRAPLEQQVGASSSNAN